MVVDAHRHGGRTAEGGVSEGLKVEMGLGFLLITFT